MTSIRIMCDQSDGTTVSLGAIKTDSDCTIIYSAHPSLIDGKFRDPVTLALLRWIGRLALNLWEHNGERPTVYESGKAVADDVLEWWKQVAASAWGFINGMEAMQ